MKKIKKYKTIQLFIYIIAAVASVCLVIFNGDIYKMMAESSEFRMVSLMIWALYILAFVFMFIDMSLYSIQDSELESLDKAAHFDMQGKIANRYGVDEIISKYDNRPAPEKMCCVVIVLSSLGKVNSEYSRNEGSKQLINFSTILNLASINRCFVGRNGGNNFLAIFEDNEKIEVSDFLDRISSLVSEYNESPNNDATMEFKYGMAHNKEENAGDIHELVSLAYDRVWKKA